MFRGNRLNLAAVGLVFAALITIIFCLGLVNWAKSTATEYERQSAYRIADYSENIYRKQRNSCVRLVPKVKQQCEWELDEAKRTYEHDQEDLVAQKSAAFWGYVMGVSAVFGMGLSIIGVCLIWTTFRETRKANQISRDANRAWIGISVSESGKFWLSTEKLEFYFDVILENHGSSPAIEVFCRGFIVLGDPKGFDLPPMEDVMPAKHTDSECIVFQNSKPLRTELIAEWKSEQPDRAEINLIVACRYKILGHQEWRRSTRTFQLRPGVEMYSTSGRFRLGICELSIPDNTGEKIELLLKERNDCPPTAS